MRRGLVVAVALALVSGSCSLWEDAADNPPEQECSDFGMVGKDGKTYHRDPDLDCKFGDGLGNIVPESFRSCDPQRDDNGLRRDPEHDCLRVDSGGTVYTDEESISVN